MKKTITAISFLLAINSAYASNCDTKELRERVLTKIGYAPTTESMETLENYCNYENWINDQLKDINLYSDKKIINKEKSFKIHQNDHIQFAIKYYKLNSINTEDVLKELMSKRIDYALYSENRIREMMFVFWMNHFSLYAEDQIYDVNSYEEIFRKNGFGKFKDILWEVVHHPAMLHFLDGEKNVKPTTITRYGMPIKLGYNENYAREFLELHTMGINSGYTQKDIEELTKILTGFSTPSFVDLKLEEKFGNLDNIKNFNDYEKYLRSNPQEISIVYPNLTIFRNKLHDNTDKVFLGKTIKGNNEKEIKEVIDIVSALPQTANFISKKIGLYFLGEEPTVETLKDMSKVFLETDGDISLVLKYLLNSEQFKKTLNKEITFKNPYEYYISTTKLTLNGKHVDNYNTIYYQLLTAGVHPYFKLTPEGYSLKGEDYLSQNFLHQYINFSKFLTSPGCFNTELNLNENYYKMKSQDYLGFLISKQWLYK
jgi:uncharacterized protein (DUF1800 family)